MSKRSLFWNDSSGKLGNVVNYRAGGEQRSRQYVAKIKNPKTLPQQLQRISMHNLVAFFKARKSVLRSAFPLKAQNQSAWNAFVSGNKSTPRTCPVSNETNSGECAPVGLTVSVGDVVLNTGLTVDTSIKPSWDAQALNQCALLPSLFNHPSVTPSQMGFTEETLNQLDLCGLTGGDLYKYLKASEAWASLPVKFKVTIMFGWYQDDAVKANTGWNPDIWQIECYESSTDKGRMLYSQNMNNQYPLYAFNDSSSSKNINTPIGSLGFLLGVESKDAPVAAIIVSWTENGKVRCTTSMMQGALEDKDYFDQFREGSEDFAMSLQDYGVTETDAMGTVNTSALNANVGLTLNIRETNGAGSDLEG